MHGLVRLASREPDYRGQFQRFPRWFQLVYAHMVLLDGQLEGLRPFVFRRRHADSGSAGRNSFGVALCLGSTSSRVGRRRKLPCHRQWRGRRRLVRMRRDPRRSAIADPRGPGSARTVTPISTAGDRQRLLHVSDTASLHLQQYRHGRWHGAAGAAGGCAVGGCLCIAGIRVSRVAGRGLPARGAAVVFASPAQLAQQAYARADAAGRGPGLQPAAGRGWCRRDGGRVLRRGCGWTVGSLAARSVTAAAGPNRATVTARPVSVSFDPGDGSPPVVCPGGGRP